jgi:hypothetical protein
VFSGMVVSSVNTTIIATEDHLRSLKQYLLSKLGDQAGQHSSQCKSRKIGTAQRIYSVYPIISAKAPQAAPNTGPSKRPFSIMGISPKLRRRALKPAMVILTRKKSGEYNAYCS